MDKRTVTAQEVRDTFLVENIEQAVADIAQTMGELLDYKTSEEILVNCCTSLPEEQRQGFSRYDRLCWIARQAFLAGYLQATETLLETAKTGYTALFAGGGKSNSSCSLQAVTGQCRAVERGRSCMNGKHLPPLRIEPQEAIALFTHAKVEEMYRVKDLYTAYREARGTDTDSLWGIMSLLSFVYDTARIQGIREERARRT